MTQLHLSNVMIFLSLWKNAGIDDRIVFSHEPELKAVKIFLRLVYLAVGFKNR